MRFSWNDRAVVKGKTTYDSALLFHKAFTTVLSPSLYQVWWVTKCLSTGTEPLTRSSYMTENKNVFMSRDAFPSGFSILKIHYYNHCYNYYNPTENNYDSAFIFHLCLAKGQSSLHSQADYVAIILFGHLRPGDCRVWLPRALSGGQLEAATAGESSVTEICESQAEDDASALESSGSLCACNLKFKVFTLVYKTNPLWPGQKLPSH